MKSPCCWWEFLFTCLSTVVSVLQSIPASDFTPFHTGLAFPWGTQSTTIAGLQQQCAAGFVTQRAQGWPCCAWAIAPKSGVLWPPPTHLSWVPCLWQEGSSTKDLNQPQATLSLCLSTNNYLSQILSACLTGQMHPQAKPQLLVEFFEYYCTLFFWISDKKFQACSFSLTKTATTHTAAMEMVVWQQSSIFFKPYIMRDNNIQSTYKFY